MTGWEQRVAARTLDSLVPRRSPKRAEEWPRPSSMDWRAYHDQFLGALGFGERLGVRLLVLAFAFGPLLVVGRPRAVWSLDEAAADRYAQRWFESRWYPVRLAVTALKSWAFLLWAGDPGVQRRLGAHQIGQRSAAPSEST